MQRIIYLLGPELPGYAVDQAHLLSRYLPADQFSSELVVPGRAGSVELAALPTTSISAGLAGLFDLRRLCTAAPPACVHAWGMSAARLLAILLRGRWCTRGVGSFLVPAATVGSLAALGGWLTRRLIAPLPAPAVPWAVEYPAEPIPQRELTTLGIPAEAELIVALGDHSRTGNLNTAVWAFDVLRYIHPRAWLVIIGRGPRRDRTERFARAVAREDYRVRFVDVPFAQISRWCQRASVVWVTRAAAVVAVGSGRAGSGSAGAGLGHRPNPGVCQRPRGGFAPGQRPRLGLGVGQSHAALARIARRVGSLGPTQPRASAAARPRHDRANGPHYRAEHMGQALHGKQSRGRVG
jgi:hypothetical protein